MRDAHQRLDDRRISFIVPVVEYGVLAHPVFCLFSLCPPAKPPDERSIDIEPSDTRTTDTPFSEAFSFCMQKPYASAADAEQRLRFLLKPPCECSLDCEDRDQGSSAQQFCTSYFAFSSCLNYHPDPTPLLSLTSYYTILSLTC